MIMGYVVNRAQVIAELFDDEVVIINLDRGSYYSLEQAGLLIWRAIEAAADKPTIEGLLAERYSAEPGQIDDGLRQFFDELCAEALIIPGQTSSLATILTASAAPRSHRPAAGYSHHTGHAGRIHRPPTAIIHQRAVA